MKPRNSISTSICWPTRVSWKDDDNVQRKGQNPTRQCQCGFADLPGVADGRYYPAPATLVPVGKDQEQHLEMARISYNGSNYRYGEVFPEPWAFNYGSELVKCPASMGRAR